MPSILAERVKLPCGLVLPNRLVKVSVYYVNNDSTYSSNYYINIPYSGRNGRANGPVGKPRTLRRLYPDL
jgi:hypothetical protein